MTDSNNHWAVDLKNVNKRYPHFTLRDLNLRLPRGEILGLVGPNGAGKSTCLRLLMGFIQADSGEICVLNKVMPEHSVWLRTRAAFVSEDMRLFAGSTIEWHIGFVKKFFDSWDDGFAQQLLKNFDLNPKQKIKELSLGQRVKTTLLLALARRPQLLVLDEPSTGLDPIARFELTSQLFDIMLNAENSVIFSSQFTQDVERLSDSIAFMDQGSVINHQDKESYLDKWRRLSIRGTGEFPLSQDTLDVQASAGGYSFIHAEFGGAVLQQLTAAGFQVDVVQPMTLEEIFIHQVRYHRQKQGNIYNV